METSCWFESGQGHQPFAATKRAHTAGEILEGGKLVDAPDFSSRQTARMPAPSKPAPTDTLPQFLHISRPRASSPRGIAHIFDNLMGMTTINRMHMHFDLHNKDFIRGSDVMNILRGTSIDKFPVFQVDRFRSPRWLCHLMVKQQRIGIRRSSSNYPFQFKHGGKNFAFIPQR